jgi:hypothetical protein
VSNKLAVFLFAVLLVLAFGMGIAVERSRQRTLIERAIEMGWHVGEEGGSLGSITYEDVVSGADYD